MSYKRGMRGSPKGGGATGIAAAKLLDSVREKVHYSMVMRPLILSYVASGRICLSARSDLA